MASGSSSAPNNPSRPSSRPDSSDRSRPGTSNQPPRSLSTEPSESTALLQNVLRDPAVHEGPCSHGTFSPRVPSPVSSSHVGGDSGRSSSSGPVDSVLNIVPGSQSWRRRLARKMKTRSAHTSQALAEQAGFNANARMYVGLCALSLYLSLPLPLSPTPPLSLGRRLY